MIEVTLIDSGNLIYFESKGHGSHDVFYIVSSDAEVRHGIKALWTGFELYAENYPDEIDLNFDDGNPK